MAECRFRPLGGVLKPDVTSPVDKATTVFSSCFVDIYRLSCTVSTLLARLLLRKMAERRFRPLGACQTGSEVTIRFLDPIWFRSVLDFSAIFYLSKVIRLFRFACKMPFEIFGEGIFPYEKIFSSTRPPKGPSLDQSASFDASCVQIGSVVWSVGPADKNDKKR
jgi:hypothetical protein